MDSNIDDNTEFNVSQEDAEKYETFVNNEVSKDTKISDMYEPEEKTFIDDETMQKFQYSITIDWVRHAESCANLNSGSVIDVNTKRDVGYDRIKSADTSHTTSSIAEPLYTYAKKATILPSVIKAACRYHPNLSYIGMQHAINLGILYIKRETLFYDAVFVSPTLRAISTAMLALRGIENFKIYVVPYISEVINLCKPDYQNMPVSSDILKRQIFFFKEWLVKNLNVYDDIELINALLDIKESFKNDDAVVTIVDSILKCKRNIYNGTYFGTPNYDKCNYNIISILISLDEILQTKKYDTKFLKMYINSNSDFFRGPEVDFSILEHYEETDKEFPHTKVPTFSKFYKKIIPYCLLKGIIPNKPTIKLLCVSHGEIMKRYFGFKYNEKPEHPMNTQVFREKLFVDAVNKNQNIFMQTGKINFNYFNPQKIRSVYENFEIFNPDICATQGLKGILNFPLWDVNDPTVLNKMYSQIPGINWMKQPRENAQTNVQFYFDNKSKYNDYKGSDENKSIVGGFERSLPLVEHGLHLIVSKYKDLYNNNKLSYIKLSIGD